MSDWDEKAEDYAVAHHTYGHLDASENALYVSGFMRGARWQRKLLLSDESVERAARALYETDREEYSGDEPWPTSIEGLNDMYRERARTALTAAIGDNHE